MQNNNSDSEEDEIIAAAAAVIILAAQVPLRSCWVREWVGRRETHGAYATIVQELMNEDPQAYKQFVRMRYEHFRELEVLVDPLIRRQDTVMRQSIKPGERLAVTQSKCWGYTTYERFLLLHLLLLRLTDTSSQRMKAGSGGTETEIEDAAHRPSTKQRCRPDSTQKALEIGTYRSFRCSDCAQCKCTLRAPNLDSCTLGIFDPKYRDGPSQVRSTERRQNHSSWPSWQYRNT
ncbi:hypothetical protein BaRGS_00013352 [Batillaria attramentaria]|uniref:Uncharacterized protein n=1 Tax=Batillaria attramentaria TaxID=370345 RepID=A0ABD0L7G1_9CAEN